MPLRSSRPPDMQSKGEGRERAHHGWEVRADIDGQALAGVQEARPRWDNAVLLSAPVREGGRQSSGRPVVGSPGRQVAAAD